MPNRPAIPLPLRRRILVESGHRCSIATCRQHPVDVHHIEPYEKCLSHEYENLIALCPTCHRRAHRGDINKKSMLQYKAKVSALWSDKGEKHKDTIEHEKAQDWIIKEFIQKSELYHFDSQTPYFLNEELKELNLVIKAWSLEQLHRLRGYFLHDGRYTTESISFTVTYFSESLVSLKFFVYSYTKGAAHPNYFTEVMNYTRRPVSPIEISSLFRLSSDYLEALSKLSQKYLHDLLGEQVSASDWAIAGSSAKKDNFRKFNLTEYGLLITFDTYQIAPHAAGMHKVLIPYQQLRDFLNPKLPV